MFELGANAWHLLTDDNKQKIQNTITKSPTLSKMSRKVLIIAELAEYVPKIDFNIIPERFKEVLQMFGVSPDVNSQILISELNNHIEGLIKFIDDNEQIVIDKLNGISDKLNDLSREVKNMQTNILKGGRYKTRIKRKNKTNKKRRSLKYISSRLKRI
jgi:hypothetical protein